MTDQYRNLASRELKEWKDRVSGEPSVSSQLASNFQARVNRLIPEKIHSVVTSAIREMTRAVIMGSEFSTFKKKHYTNLEELEQNVKSRIKWYSSTAATEGAITGFGGIALGLADLPLWLSIKMKMLFDIASCYGVDTKELRERVYILYIFQLTFCSQNHRKDLYRYLENWEAESKNLPGDLRGFDWKTFQLQYRDHIDLRKLLQLIPGAGAVVGAYVNHSLTAKLGEYAINGYRMRIMKL